MTEPMSDEIAVLAEVITAGIPKALSRLEAGQFKRRADSLIRGFVSGLKAKLSPPIPPDVKAAMERYKRHMPDSEGPSPYWLASKKAWDNQRLTADVWTITNWAVSHFGLFPVVDGQGVGE